MFDTYPQLEKQDAFVKTEADRLLFLNELAYANRLRAKLLGWKGPGIARVAPKALTLTAALVSKQAMHLVGLGHLYSPRDELETEVSHSKWAAEGCIFANRKNFESGEHAVVFMVTTGCQEVPLSSIVDSLQLMLTTENEEGSVWNLGTCEVPLTGDSATMALAVLDVCDNRFCGLRIPTRPGLDLPSFYLGEQVGRAAMLTTSCAQK